MNTLPMKNDDFECKERPTSLENPFRRNNYVAESN